jgi:hypothetical protein
MTEADKAARGWPTTYRLTRLVQQAPGVWIRAVHAPQSVLDEITARLIASQSAGHVSREDYIAAAIDTQLGPRCPDYDDDCATCSAWRDYDSGITQDLVALLAELDETDAVHATPQPWPGADGGIDGPLGDQMGDGA